MRYDGIDCIGEFFIERVASLPGWSSAYEGRMLYARDEDTLHVGIASAWRTIAKTSDVVNLTATAAEINTACDGITATAADLNQCDGKILLNEDMAKGYVSRSKFTYKDNNEIYIGPGAYHHDGTTEQYVYWNSTLEVGAGGLANKIYYHYLDDSAIVSHDSPLLTASEFTRSWSDIPIWVESKRGWYYGDDRCIFSTRSDPLGTPCEPFYHQGDLVLYADQIESHSSSVGTTWVDVVLDIPQFVEIGPPAYGLAAEITYRVSKTNAMIYYWRTNTSDVGITGHIVGGTASSGRTSDNTFAVITDRNKMIEIKTNISSTDVYIYTNGWYFPVGM
jgi:hypothetical protein